ncbi:sensor histidine kinase [Christiangramia echinicola]|uniref:sensor histidine kinase n=1 Tax=Christiangramia echinicola TaxID=279359 RepID=UPI0004274332|nr:HAMP domain-containing sensor histidine kinase [Christiangramia echinicola]
MKTAADIIKSNSNRIMKSWEDRVKNEISASQISSNLALRNQLPNVLDDISEILTRYDGFLEVERNEKYNEIIKNSLDHGRHRATSSHYTVKQILQEYVIFHRVLTEVLEENEVYSKEVGIVLKYTLETAMLTSASSFSDSLQEMREKLIGALAHDIRNPISAAYFALDIIDPDDDKERIKRLKSMGLGSLKKALELVEGLLDAISIKAGEGITLNFEAIDIIEEIKWVCEEANQIYLNEVILQSNTKESFGVFDGTAIRRVVENLVTNAIKYGARDEPVRVILEDSRENIVIRVHNEGESIDEKHQTEIFEFLKRGRETDNSRLESWGMGLTIVKSVAIAHGGKVDLKSTDEHGTTFSLSLKKYFNEPGKVRTKLNYSEK